MGSYVLSVPSLADALLSPVNINLQDTFCFSRLWLEFPFAHVPRQGVWVCWAASALL